MEGKKNIEEIYSKSLRAGRRTYFFDVRSTKAGDYYMTITESKRDFTEDGTPFYKKHKIYLYKEDFSRFKEIFDDVTKYIIDEKGEDIISDFDPKEDKNEEHKSNDNKKDNSDSSFTDIEFEDI